MTLPDAVPPEAILRVAATLMVVVRVAAGAAELRLRVPGRLWCGRWAAAGLLLHDVLVGLALLAVMGGGARWAVALTPASSSVVAAVTAVTAGAAFVLAPELLHRRRGIGLQSRFRPRRTTSEPCPTLRGRIIDLAEREGRRAASRWVGARLERCRRSCGASHEQLLPAVWPAVRLRLRDEPGASRTEVALLLGQAQRVADDASPAQDRTLGLLHLLYERAGRRAVAAALEHARRTPVRF